MPDDQWSWDLPESQDSSDRRSGDGGQAEEPSTDAPRSGRRAAAGSQPEYLNQRAARPRRAAAGHPDDADGAGDDFGRTIGFTIAGAVVPGVGLIAARRRLVGGIVLAVFLALIATMLIWALAAPRSLYAIAVDPQALAVVSVVLIVLGLAWVGVIVVSHLSLSGRRPIVRPRRIAGAVLVGVLSFVIAAPFAVAARYSYDQAGLVTSVFQQRSKSDSATRPTNHPTHRADPWKDTPRVNILLLGGDDGPGRYGTRTDTVIVASIDTQTGDTTLISLPRNTAKMPFPADSPLQEYYPSGFTDGDGNNAEFFLNAMYRNVPATVPHNILGKTDNLGADVLKLAVGEATGLKIDYYALINLKGFRKMIDALGGITVNINNYVAIGGDTDAGIPPDSYLEPGPDQHLDGDKALWFARGRYGSNDYERMDRQRCVINAVIEQANPRNVVTRYEAIAQAGKDIVQTDIPQEALPAFVDLSLRAKDGNVRSLVFKHGQDGFISGNPDFDLVRKQVKQSIGEAKKPPKKKPGGGSGGSKKPDQPKKSTQPDQPESSPSETANSESAKDACAWQPEVAAKAERPS